MQEATGKTYKFLIFKIIFLQFVKSTKTKCLQHCICTYTYSHIDIIYNVSVIFFITQLNVVKCAWVYFYYFAPTAVVARCGNEFIIHELITPQWQNLGRIVCLRSVQLSENRQFSVHIFPRTSLNHDKRRLERTHH